jgi:NAD(P)H-dependent flavin oxidoreductase YrpB (nitropropane dioxygenase family)
MKTVKVPWIAFKVLAAGAIHPKKGFDYAFNNGADFLCVGMFDFQVKEDANIATKMFNRNKDRARKWYG